MANTSLVISDGTTGGPKEAAEAIVERCYCHHCPNLELTHTPENWREQNRAL